MNRSRPKGPTRFLIYKALLSIIGVRIILSHAYLYFCGVLVVSHNRNQLVNVLYLHVFVNNLRRPSTKHHFSKWRGHSKVEGSFKKWRGQLPSKFMFLYVNIRNRYTLKKMEGPTDPPQKILRENQKV